LAETKINETASDEGQEPRGPEKKSGIVGEIARQFHELSVGVLLFYFAGEFILGFLGWKYLDHDRRVLASSFLLSGFLLACFGGWLL
jgi:hypothetical protein